MALDDEVQNTSGRRGYHHTLISFFSFLLEALGSASSTFSTTALADFSSDFMVFNSDFKTFFDESDLVVSSESFSLDKLFFVVTDPPVVRREVTVGEFLGSPRALGDEIFGIGCETTLVVALIVTSGTVTMVAATSATSGTAADSEAKTSAFSGASGEGGKFVAGRLSDLDPSTASGTYKVHGA